MRLIGFAVVVFVAVQAIEGAGWIDDASPAMVSQIGECEYRLSVANLGISESPFARRVYLLSDCIGAWVTVYNTTNANTRRSTAQTPTTTC